MAKVDGWMLGGLVEDALEIDATNKRIKKETGKARSFQDTALDALSRLFSRFGNRK
jgi:hypothetical protein